MNFLMTLNIHAKLFSKKPFSNNSYLSTYYMPNIILDRFYYASFTEEDTKVHWYYLSRVKEITSSKARIQIQNCPISKLMLFPHEF